MPTKKKGGLSDRYIICHKKLKRRKWRKVGMGPVCARKLKAGYAGIQLRAFEPMNESIFRLIKE